MKEFITCVDCGRCLMEAKKGEIVVMPTSDYNADIAETVFEIKCPRCKMYNTIATANKENSEVLTLMAGLTEKKK